MPELDPDRAVTNIEVIGPVTRVETATWHGVFSAGLARGQVLRIDLARSGPWDLAGVQLLLATMASGRRAGCSVSLAGVPNVLKVVTERAALLDRFAAITED